MSMVNRHRGELGATLDGQPYRLCLTLGALAEIEAQLGGVDILSLAQRFEGGRIAASEAICILGAGLRGGGNQITDQQLAQMQIEGGVPGYLRLVIELLHAAFGVSEPGGAGSSGGQENAPFPGGAQ